MASRAAALANLFFRDSLQVVNGGVMVMAALFVLFLLGQLPVIFLVRDVLLFDQLKRRQALRIRCKALEERSFGLLRLSVLEEGL